MNEKLVSTGNALVEHCRNGTDDVALDTLYHDTAVSVEPMAKPGEESAEVHGKEGIRKKREQWYAEFETHSTELSGPYFHGQDRFGIIFQIDATHKESGQNFKGTEFGVYTIDGDGKITREEFFFNPEML